MIRKMYSLNLIAINDYSMIYGMRLSGSKGRAVGFLSCIYDVPQRYSGVVPTASIPM